MSRPSSNAVVNAVPAAPPSRVVAVLNEIAARVLPTVVILAALIGIESETRGVESISVAEAPELVVQRAAREMSTTVAITGAQDFVSDGNRLFRIDNGHPLLATITGSGCMATSLVGAFLAVEADALPATAAALRMPPSSLTA